MGKCRERGPGTTGHRAELPIEIAGPSGDEEEVALREAEEATYQVMLHHKPVELSPQSSYIRRLQHQLVEKYNLQSRSTGVEPNRRVRVYKEAAR